MLNEKVKQIIVNSGYSPSHFADAIGAERSSISHILANRNKPSFSILQKIIKKFPELGYDWLEEDGELQSPNLLTQEPLAAKRGPKPGVNRPAMPNFSETPTNHNVQNIFASESNRKNIPDPFAAQPNLMAQALAGNEEKTVERIIVFFSDQSFKEYKAQ